MSVVADVHDNFTPSIRTHNNDLESEHNILKLGSENHEPDTANQ
jgi:hypothetical protein